MKKELTIDELATMVLIDKKDNTKLSVALKDNDGDTIEIRQVIESVTEYISDKMNQEKSNQVREEIAPLIAQAMVIGLSKIFGPTLASMILSTEEIRHGMLHMMLVGFALLKFIQKKDLKIFAIKTPISQEEVDLYIRMTKASDVMAKAAILGINPHDLLEAMIKDGTLCLEDLEKMGLSKETSEEILSKVTSLPKEEYN